jgi:hypothetical protein
MRVSSLICLTAGILSAATAHGQGLASTSNSPASTGTVITPNGPVDASCVHEVPSGSTVASDGTVTKDSKVIGHIPACAPQVSPLSIAHAWVEYSWANATPISGASNYNLLTANWTVPNAPTNKSGQTLYLFPSMQGSSGNSGIIQPVLQWLANSGHWSLASYWVGGPMGTVVSTAINVSPGDVLFGEIQQLDGPPNGPNFYEIYSQDATTGQSTVINVYPPGVFSNIEAGVYEVWNVSSCAQYPGGGVQGLSTPFYNVVVYQGGPAWNSHNHVTPNWQSVISSVSPACFLGVDLFPTETILHY